MELDPRVPAHAELHHLTRRAVGGVGEHGGPFPVDHRQVGVVLDEQRHVADIVRRHAAHLRERADVRQSEVGLPLRAPHRFDGVVAGGVDAGDPGGAEEIVDARAHRDRVVVAVARYLVVAARAAELADHLYLALTAHGVAERLAGRLVLVDRPRVHVDIDHVRLVVEVVQVDPLEHDVVHAAAGQLHEHAHVLEALVGLRFGPLHLLGRGPILRHYDGGEDVVAHADAVGQRIAVRQALDFDTLAGAADDAVGLNLDGLVARQRIGRRLARGAVVSHRGTARASRG